MKRISVKEWTAILLLTAGVAMAFIALLLPPPGEIHDSVLYVFAQILIYSGTVFGLDSYFTKKKNLITMTNEKKSKWSVIVNIILTTLTAIATAFGLTNCM